MNTRSLWYVLLGLILAFSACASDTPQEQEMAAAETTEPAKAHVGGCVLASYTEDAPADLYQVGDVVPTGEYKPFTKKLLVYGITLIGRDDISDDFMRKVAQAITEMFPRSEAMDSDLQKEILRNLYRYRATIPLFKGEDHEFSPADAEDLEETMSRNSICDIIMEGVPGQVNEVVEHILHFVSDVGLHYTFPVEWGLSQTSKIYHAMQEAIDKGHYVIDQYQEEDMDAEERTRVLIQEYAYWVIFTAWDLYAPYGPEAEWKGIANPEDMKNKLPLSYEVFQETIPRVMTPPSISTLEQFK